MKPRIVEVVLPFPPVSLNPYLRMHWGERDAIIKPYREIVANSLLGIEPFPIVYIEWEWTFFCTEKRFLDRDGDNVWSVGTKVVQDVLKHWLLKDDSNRYIQNPVLHWTFYDDTKDPEIYGSGEVLVRLSNVPLYRGQFITVEKE